MFRASGSATVSLCQARDARHQETGCKSTRANSRDLGVKVSGFTMQSSCRVVKGRRIVVGLFRVQVHKLAKGSVSGEREG